MTHPNDKSLINKGLGFDNLMRSDSMSGAPHRSIDPEREREVGAPYPIHHAVFLGKVL